MTSKDLLIHMFVLTVLLAIRLVTLCVDTENVYNKQYVMFNTSRKLAYLKKGLGIAWLWYLVIITNSNPEWTPEKYVFVALGAFECMALLDLFNGTQIPFLGQNKGDMLAKRENRVADFVDEYEYIDNYGAWDNITILVICGLIGFNAHAYYKELSLEAYKLNFSIEIALVSCLLLMKPYSGIKFQKLVTFIVPSVIILANVHKIIESFEYSLTEILIVSPYQLYLYGFTFVFYLFLNIYFWCKRTPEDKDEEDNQKILEERRRMIEERMEKIEQKQAIMIRTMDNGTGGLQGFDHIQLFKDISSVYGAIAEEFYRIKSNGDIIKEDIVNFVKLTSQQSISFISKKFFNM